MKLISVYAISAATLILFYFVNFDKQAIINLFMIDAYAFDKPDLIVVLEGGDILFAPSIERANKVVDIYNNEQAKVLLCSDSEYRKDIVNYFEINGVRKSDIISSSYKYDNNGGTYNNIREMLYVMQKMDNYRNIQIVTSPYHELRVHLMFISFINEVEFGREVNVSFSHINNSEVSKTDNARFVRIILHELMGIMFFKLRTLVND